MSATIRINIPSKKPGQFILDAMREAGISPRAASSSLPIRDLVVAWGAGKLSRHDFIQACRRVAILNPRLRTR